MSQRLTKVWEARPDAFGPRRYRKPCKYSAYLPDVLPSLPLEMSPDLAADVSDAEHALVSFDVRTQQMPDLEQLARFLLRAEAVASSKIEGLQVSSRRLARHEAEAAAGSKRRDITADAVLGNVAAMTIAVSRVASADSVTVGHVLEIHKALMEQSDRPDLGAVVRTEQNWIGGNDFNPCSAQFVPPPPEYVDELMEDLCAFINSDDLPAVVQAALVHAQFETIHPFMDGNGRTGRALIHVVLRRRGLATGFIPPISLVLATKADAYVDALTAFRYDGPPTGEQARQGIRTWLDLFVAATQRATADAREMVNHLNELEAKWRAAAQPRRNSAVDRLLPQLLAHPVIRAEDVMRLTGASRAAAFTALDRCQGAGIVKQVGGGQRFRLFEAPEVFDVLTDFERGLATETGDTRSEKPRRPVPYRRAAE